MYTYIYMYRGHKVPQEAPGRGPGDDPDGRQGPPMNNICLKVTSFGDSYSIT